VTFSSSKPADRCTTSAAAPGAARSGPPILSPNLTLGQTEVIEAERRVRGMDMTFAVPSVERAFSLKSSQ
jgi:hypothetical protein